MNPAQVVEAVLFASDAPLAAEEIARADESLNEDLVEEAIRELNAVYSESERAFEIRELGEGYQLLTRADFAPYLERFDTVPRPSHLSGPALETLAIIAYRQPIGRIEMEYIRGVSSAGVIRTLQDRALVDVVARGEGLGRPLLYGTSQRFLEHFGFRSLEDLPRPEELPIILSERAPLEEDTPLEETSEVAPEDEPAESEPGVEEVLAEPESAMPDSGPNGGGHGAGEPEEIQDPEDTDRD
jgi:segregation and condensation protein B